MLLFITSRSLCYLSLAAVAGLRFVSYSRHLVLTRGAGVSAVSTMSRQHPRVQGRRGRQPCDLGDLLRFEIPRRPQVLGEWVELLRVRGKKRLGLLVPLADDLAPSGMDRFGIFPANRLGAAVTARP